MSRSSIRSQMDKKESVEMLLFLSNKWLTKEKIGRLTSIPNHELSEIMLSLMKDGILEITRPGGYDYFRMNRQEKLRRARIWYEDDETIF